MLVEACLLRKGRHHGRKGRSSSEGGGVVIHSSLAAGGFTAAGWSPARGEER